jgi:hypothetical protein
VVEIRVGSMAATSVVLSDGSPVVQLAHVGTEDPLYGGFVEIPLALVGKTVAALIACAVASVEEVMGEPVVVIDVSGSGVPADGTTVLKKLQKGG